MKKRMRALAFSGLLFLTALAACKQDPYQKPPDVDKIRPKLSNSTAPTASQTKPPPTQKTEPTKSSPPSKDKNPSLTADSTAKSQPNLSKGTGPSISVDELNLLLKMGKNRSSRKKSSLGVGSLELDSSLKMPSPFDPDSLSQQFLSTFSDSYEEKKEDKKEKYPTSAPATASTKPSTKPQNRGEGSPARDTSPLDRAENQKGPSSSGGTGAPADSPARREDSDLRGGPAGGTLPSLGGAGFGLSFGGKRSGGLFGGGAALSETSKSKKLIDTELIEESESSERDWERSLPDVLAKVNGEPVKKWAFLLFYRQLKKLWQWKMGYSPEGSELKVLRKKALEKLIDQVIVYQQARQRGLTVTPEERKRQIQTILAMSGGAKTIDEFLKRSGIKPEHFSLLLDRQILSKKYLLLLARQIPISESDLMNYYRQFYGKRSAKVRQILISTSKYSPAEAEKRAWELYRQLRSSPEKFEELARKFSDDPTAESGGDLGRMEEGSLIPQLDRAVFSLAPGQISRPVRSELGFHIFKVEEVSSPPPYKAVRMKLLQELQMRKLKEFTEKKLRALRDDYVIEILVPWGK